MKRLFFITITAFFLAGCINHNNKTINKDLENALNNAFPEQNKDVSENFVVQLPKDEFIINTLIHYKKMYDNFFGYKQIYLWCRKDLTNMWTSGRYIPNLCIPLNREALVNNAGVRHLSQYKKHITKNFPFLKEIQKENSNISESYTNAEKLMRIEITIAHELSHIYAPLYNSHNPILNQIVLNDEKTSIVTNNTAVHELTDETFADLLAATALKEKYGNTKQLRTFLHKYRYERMATSAITYEVKDPHFWGLLYEEGIDLALSYSFTPESFAKLLAKAEELGIKSAKLFGPISSSTNETSVIKRYNYLRACDDAWDRNKCYMKDGMDQSFSQMYYEEFKEKYDRVFKKYFPEFK